MGQRGTDILLKIGDDIIGGQRNLALDRTADAIDMSSKQDGDARNEQGRRSSSLTVDVLYDPTDSAYVSLETAYEGRTKITAYKVENGAVTKTSQCIVTNIGEAHPDNGASVVSVGLTLDGGWTGA